MLRLPAEAADAAIAGAALGNNGGASADTIAVAIVGIGQTPYSKGLGRSEFDMAVEAILAACADAGISPREISRSSSCVGNSGAPSS